MIVRHTTSQTPHLYEGEDRSIFKQNYFIFTGWGDFHNYVRCPYRYAISRHNSCTYMHTIEESNNHNSIKNNRLEGIYKMKISLHSTWLYWLADILWIFHRIESMWCDEGCLLFANIPGLSMHRKVHWLQCRYLSATIPRIYIADLSTFYHHHQKLNSSNY